LRREDSMPKETVLTVNCEDVWTFHHEAFNETFETEFTGKQREALSRIIGVYLIIECKKCGLRLRMRTLKGGKDKLLTAHCIVLNKGDATKHKDLNVPNDLHERLLICTYKSLFSQLEPAP